MKGKEIINFINSINMEDLESFIEQKKKSLKVKLFLIIFSIICIIFGGPIGVIFILFFYFGFFKTLKLFIAQGKFMKNYAKLHNFSYQNIIDTSELKGRLFKKNSGTARNIITGVYNKFPIRIFYYTYSTGGENSRTYSFTVGEIEVEKTNFPHIFLKSNSMSRHISQDFFGQDKDIKINLTQNIEDTFNLFCTQNYEIEILEIFTPDLLNFLKTNAFNFSIEFAEDKIYFYDDIIIKNKKDLDQLYNVIQKVLDSSGQLFYRLHDDFEVMHTFFKK